MYQLVSVLIIIVCILLILIVLVQNSKGGGLAANFASSNQVMGVRQTADFLEKATWTLAITLLVLSFVATMSIPQESDTANRSAIEQQVQDSQNQNNLPNFPVGTQTPSQDTTK